MNDHFPINCKDRILPSVTLPHSIHRTTSQDHKNACNFGRITYRIIIYMHNSVWRGWNLGEGLMALSTHFQKRMSRGLIWGSLLICHSCYMKLQWPLCILWGTEFYRVQNSTGHNTLQGTASYRAQQFTGHSSLQNSHTLLFQTKTQFTCHPLRL